MAKEVSNPSNRVQTSKEKGDESSASDLSGEIRTEIVDAILPILQPGQAKQVAERIAPIVVTHVRSEQFSGPCPHPKHFEHYERVLPGSADRMLAMVEKDQDKAHAMAEKVVDAQIEDRRAGRWFGFAALITLAIIALISAYLGYETLAYVLFGTGALGVVTQLINGVRLRYEDKTDIAS